MRYTYKFKKKCVELYKEGKYLKTPEGLTTRIFHKYVRLWYRLSQVHGIEVLKPSNTKRKWNPEEKYELVKKVLSNNSIGSVAVEAGISSSLLQSWVRKYEQFGYNGLIKKLRNPNERRKVMKKTSPEYKLKETEYQELIRLRAENKHIKKENAYIKAENAVIKKEIALREEKMIARLKAKKQQSSRSSVRKDTH